MSETTELPEWLWIVIEKDGELERLFGQHEQEKDVFFVPAFNSQEDGQACLQYLQKMPERKYEIHAMRSAEVINTIEPYNYQLFILDSHGQVLESLAPAPEQQ
ncbi:MAG: hypothetical protein JRI95_00040 [Deltaproteobacteria bacterium]|nr:hypothetical protein [Deltaproteobacteria bacterium]MBW2085245.1 hypothetical protein [Deltaproteobacteria bacterium]